MPDTPILELENVVKQYQAPDGSAATPVLRGITLSIAPGESLAIVGPSGSGKSTLLNIMGTLDRPTSGRMLLEGRDLASADDEALAAVRNRRIGFVFQLHHLLPQCTALENVLVPTLAPGATRRPADAEADAHRLLARMGLEDRLTYRPGQLSGGERQRVAVARALINRPAILLADEPTGSLDRTSAEELTAILAELNHADGMTLVVVTHSSALASQMGRRFELKDGRLAPVA
jgi:ABC-type lipoprotein export system ATPase subunit